MSRIREIVKHEDAGLFLSRDHEWVFTESESKKLIAGMLETFLNQDFLIISRIDGEKYLLDICDVDSKPYLTMDLGQALNYDLEFIFACFQDDDLEKIERLESICKKTIKDIEEFKKELADDR